ncbi:glycosyl hydrolase [candidate division KSB1 bacterium]|nr:glycosyl hydrolase [candidate division KSB1 bacterium]
MKKNIWFFLLIMIASYSCQQNNPRIVEQIDMLSDAWPGYAISYSGYREGQNPQEFIYPSRQEVKEDLEILEKNWRLIRLYGSDQHSLDVLHVIREEKIDLKVMLGIWLDGEPGHEADNQLQIQKGIELANDYTDIVIAVNVGNEILVHWSDHQIPLEKVLHYVHQVKQAVSVPVTVADDFSFWRDHGSELAQAVDFVTLHTYPIWGGRDIEDGLSVTIEHYQSVKNAFPDKKVVIGEAGWATYTVGELHAPRAGDESKQKIYFNQLMDWAYKNNVIVFFFEAFDEPWKGSGTEGHWGLFTEQRKAKLAMQELYPDLMPEGPTLPAYDE